MAYHSTPLPRSFRFKFGMRRRHPVIYASAIATTWIIGTVLLMAWDGTLAQTLGWPWSREAIALVLVPLAGMLWMVLPSHRVRIVVTIDGLSISTGRAFLSRRRHISWRQIDCITLHRAGQRAKTLCIDVKSPTPNGGVRRLRAVKTRSAIYLPSLLSTIGDYAQSAGYQMDGDLIDGNLSGTEIWHVAPCET